jgi:hypothetical protein
MGRSDLRGQEGRLSILYNHAEEILTALLKAG